MDIALVIIIGAVVGYATFKIKGSIFSLGWNIYLGVIGSITANLFMIWAYFMNLTPMPNTIGANFYSIALDLAGAAAFILAARYYKKNGYAKTGGFRIYKF